jgi:hypothetical protein
MNPVGSSHERTPTDPTQPDVTAVTSANINSDLSHLEDGPYVTAETSCRIACDCSIYDVTITWCMRAASLVRACRMVWDLAVSQMCNQVFDVNEKMFMGVCVGFICLPLRVLPLMEMYESKRPVHVDFFCRVTQTPLANS